jgi:amino acid transporter
MPLPVLSADALSSVAYGPQAMLPPRSWPGLPGLSYLLPIGAAIVLLMLAAGVSYRQTIPSYPRGGGSYIVASEELGRVPRPEADAGLLIDYVMTVAVSIASGFGMHEAEDCQGRAAKGLVLRAGAGFGCEIRVRG